MKKRVLVVSSANMDMVQRIRRVPASGETVLESRGTYSYVPGGKGANSAIAMARLGADCVFVCKVGDDANGKILTNLYRSEGIDTRYVIVDGEAPTGLASILVEESGANRIIVFPGANGTLGADDVEECFNCYPDALYVQFEIPDAAVLEACASAHKREIPIFVDAAPAREDFPLEKIGPVEMFSLNENECAVFTGIDPVNEENCLRASIKLRGITRAKYVVLKLGARGAFLFDGEEYFSYPAERVRAVDTTAAGDVFTAALTTYYVNHGNIGAAIRFGNAAAGLSVSRPGASTSIPTLEELAEYKREKEERENS